MTIKETMTVTDICSIVEKCALNGVKDFHLGELHIQFKENTSVIAPTIDDAPVYIPPEVQEKIESQAKDAIEIEEIRAKQDRLAHAMIEDPELFEQLLLAGDLDGRQEI